MCLHASGSEKVGEEIGSQGYHEWTPFPSLDFRVVSVYMQTQKCIISCLLGFIRIWAGSVSQGGRKKSLGRRVREKGDLIRTLGSSLTGLELGIIRL